MAVKRIEFRDNQNELVSVMLLKDPEDNTRSVSTPEWMIKVDDLFESTYQSFEKYSELLGYELSVGRETKEHVSGSLNSSGVVQHSDIYVIIHVETSMPKILGKLYKGETLKEIQLVRLTNVKGERQRMQELTFKTCHIDFVKQVSNDMLAFRFRAIERDDKVFKYKQEGEKAGQTFETFKFHEGQSTGG